MPLRRIAVTDSTVTLSGGRDCATNGVSGPIRRISVRRDGHCE